MEWRDSVMTTILIELPEKNRTLTAEKNFSEEQLFSDEFTILHFLKDNFPDMAPAYECSVEKGRQGILNRLAGSMVREDIMGLTSDSYDLFVMDTTYAINVPVINDYWKKVMRELHTYGLKNGDTYKLYPLSEKNFLMIPVGQTYAFNRAEVNGQILQVSELGIKPIDNSVELLHLMSEKEQSCQEKGKSSWVKLEEELTNGSANLSLSYAYWELKKKDLQQQAAEHEITNTIDWVLFRKKQDPGFDSSLFFEQLSIEGHNLHPGTKTKVGMDPEDVFRYSPEFDGAADLQFVGIRKDYAEWKQEEEKEMNPNALLFIEYPELSRTIEKQFAECQLQVNDYVFVPVHPWQMEHAIPDIYETEIQQRIVIPIHGLKIPSGATSSFRTLVPLKAGTKHSIKVAINSQMTSTVRSISANTTNNAAVITRLIRLVMEREQELSKTFVPVCECAGFNFKLNQTGDLSDNQKLKNRNLSAVLRENVETFVNLEEVAIVGSSLFSQSPITEKTILVELIEKYAEECKESSLRKAAFQFASEYASIALPGFLTLMVKYGIGLEGHLQNSVMVFKNGRPVRMLFRDWGGSRIHLNRLEQSGLQTEFYPNSATVTNCLKEMHNKVFYTVLQNHCGELLLQVCQQFGLKEEELWQEIHVICETVFDQLETTTYAENARIDRVAFYQEKVDYKALTKMRLAPEGKDYSYTSVPNPLFECHRKEV
jgi:siderophore synthetase component